MFKSLVAYVYAVIYQWNLDYPNIHTLKITPNYTVTP